MKKVFIVHGFKSTPNNGWRSWLMSELSKENIYCCALPMPNPLEPKKEEWVNLISQFCSNPGDEIYLVGHSLGVPAILRYLEAIDENKKIMGAVLVSGPIKKVSETEETHVVRVTDEFYQGGFDFEKIKFKSDKFVIIHGDDDPKVPVDNAETLSKELAGKLVLIKNGKHLSGHEGFNKLPEVLIALKEMIK